MELRRVRLRAGYVIRAAMLVVLVVQAVLCLSHPGELRLRGVWWTLTGTLYVLAYCLYRWGGYYETAARDKHGE